MSMIDTIRSEMVTAMKEKNKLRKETLSALLTALKNVAIDKRADLTEAEEGAIVKKEIKTLTETLESCPADRTDIIEETTGRINILKEFAPEEMTEEQIQKVIDDTLAELGISAPTAKDKGKIMKNLMPKVKGKADGKLVNEMVSRLF